MKWGNNQNKAFLVNRMAQRTGKSIAEEEELDFIIRSALPLCNVKNYGIKYRMGDELNEE